MTFTEWYKKEHDDEWNPIFAEMYGLADAMQGDYYEYCKEHNIKPIWNG
ncbi:hypothetical protein PD280_06205 [Virgibacillus salarius]|nr:hypothetical protein [Virgibacillus salarius]WBX81310.1 hypothetical protein PD280_06205 [Virgibacillus salarius]